MIKTELLYRAEYFKKVAMKATDPEYKAKLYGQAYGLELALSVCDKFYELTSPERLKILLERFGIEKHIGPIAENISANLRAAFNVEIED